jgi:hypothetical protein
VQKGLGKGNRRRGSQAGNTAVDHAARRNRLHGVLPSRKSSAAVWCGLCADA